MKKTLLIASLVGMFAFASCGNKNQKEGTVEEVSVEETLDKTATPETAETQDIVTMFIGPKKVDCTGVGPMKCLQVKETEDGEWTLLYSSIQGFEYEEGYNYKLEVRREDVPNPPADAPSVRYILVKEISKTKA
ncbi:DUF4377 domain-containing protein [Myroides sp. 1354]|uniref:DUF4377 domain-containing protein n=1 Tax=unclassified Myroides TaxID=2642485 RepID=UPI0025766692|nr:MULTISPECIES: DUF4377 domain-containing protein [unclassified Myroides]MDM1044810.1 DUF4377 domain-containing protein [Myroides sp. R163-1]MDM1055523.1 DUF4377 domain-containing protein [Myroides sp. 1354]MDM1068820.1 DUF4377 domain-containing protein [Myroides sp. 1372]